MSGCGGSPQTVPGASRSEFILFSTFKVRPSMSNLIGVESSREKLAFTRVCHGPEHAVTDVFPAMGGIARIPIFSSQNRMPETFGACHHAC